MTDKNKNFHTGFTFSKHIPEEVSHFDRVFGVFKDLLIHTSGDLDEAFDWLDMLDKEYDIFTINKRIPRGGDIEFLVLGKDQGGE